MRARLTVLKTATALEGQFFFQGIRQAGVPFTSSNLSVAKPGRCCNTVSWGRHARHDGLSCFERLVFGGKGP